MNEKNRLIGIIFATYNSEDSQNLNYAISIQYLKKLYKDLENKNYIYVNNSIILDKNYKVSSIEKFYNNTNKRELFENSLNYSWKKVYDGFSEKEKIETLDFFEEIDKKTYTNHNLSEWETIDYLINLNILNKKECAIVVLDIYNKDTSDNIFEIINNYNLGAFEKTMVALLLGGFTPRDLTDTDASRVIDRIDEMNYSLEEKGIIARFLGYKVNGTNVSW